MSLSVCRSGLVDGCMDGRKYQARPISFVQTHSRKMPETASEGGGQAQEEREGRASSESCVILLKSFRLWLNMARCFVLGVGFIYSNDLLTFNPYIHTRLKTRRSLLMSPQPRFFYFLIIIF